MAKDDLTKTVADFRDKYFRFFPKKATELGNHDYDDSLGKWNREGVRERITFLQHYRDLIKDSLEIDALIIKNILDSNLFHLKVIRPHTRLEIVRVVSRTPTKMPLSTAAASTSLP